MKIYEQLKFLQKALNLSQEKLAQKIGVSFATVNSWICERSLPRAKFREKIENLVLKYSGQKKIPASKLIAKKSLFKNDPKIWKKFLTRPDLRDELILKLTYNTDKIEGSTLTEAETARVIFTDFALGNRSLREQIEAKNHRAAFDFLFKSLSQNSKITENLILKLHQILMNGILDDAGFYRRHAVRIVGANVATANFLRVPDLMKNLISEINKKPVDAISHISKIHAEFERIHPFADGNGRIGRLLMNAMAFVKNLAPVLILEKHKNLYYKFLQKAQNENDSSLLEDFVCDSMGESLKLLK